MDVNSSAPATKLLVGLGNPGRDYQETRHNLGFKVADALLEKADAFSLSEWQPSNGELFQAVFGGRRAWILKPMTFMNSSGVAVGEVCMQLGLSPQELLVVSDDLDMELGRIRLRAKGSNGGHRGIGSIMEILCTEEFPRLRVGIGRPRSGEESVVDYVLGSWTSDEIIAVRHVIDQAAAMAMNAIAVAPLPASWKLAAEELGTSSDFSQCQKQGDPEVEKL